MNIATETAAVEIADDDYEDTGLYHFIGPLVELPDLEPDAPVPSPAEHAHHLEFIRRRDWAAGELWRADREAERHRRQAEFRAMRDAWIKRPANDNRPASTGRFDLTWFGDIDTTQVKKTFVKGVLGDGEFTMASGLPGTGKSAIMTDVACHVAAGMDWHGRKVRQGFVVYIAAERKKLTERRMAAFRKRHGIGKIPLLVLGGFIDMTSTNVDTRALIAAIRQAEGQCGQACVWVIIDTLTRVFGPGDQNASKDMGRFVANCDLMLKETGAHVTVIHHTAWSGERGKGAIDLDGAVDASFMVKKKGGGSYTLECDGANDAEDGVVTTFRMESVTVGEDEDGNPTTAPVIVPDDAKEAAEAFVASGHAGKALDVLRDLRRWGGVVDLEAWRKDFYAVYPSEKPGTLKARFRRARETLQARGAILEEDGAWRLTPGGTPGTCTPDVPRTDSEDGISREAVHPVHTPIGVYRVPSREPGKEEVQERDLIPDEGHDGEVEMPPVSIQDESPDIGVAEAEMVVVDTDHPSPYRLEGDGGASRRVREADPRPSGPHRSRSSDDEELTDEQIPAFLKREPRH
ncbi:MAG: AAA family ATPase [Bosea sp.]|uniref:AAA family ATPase n=1 Tax=Bosea sp. (in: a-proteobacteria) TaxID=1871050 RepID=UPI001AC78CBC|nr:AAA family ATPase [Bosea sp. (in: a-proteobacteria)]MBN9470208.1 AAA family ATPase [Bosea sp. (in: a-proteobacteria)]